MKNFIQNLPKAELHLPVSIIKFILILLMVTINGMSYGQGELIIIKDPNESEFNVKRYPKSIKNNENYTAKTITRSYKKFWYKGFDGKQSLWGLAKNDEVILPILFSGEIDRELIYSHLLLHVKFKDQMGLFNLNSSTWSVPIMYKKIDYMTDSLCIVTNKKGKKGVIDINNNILLNLEWDEIIDFKTQYTKPYIIVGKKGLNGLRYGVFSTKETKFIIPCEYKNIHIMPLPARAKHEKFIYYDENNKMNILDERNIKLFRNDYDTIVPHYPVLSHNTFIVKVDNKMGIIDQDERITTSITYQYISTVPFFDGSYLAINEEGMYGCLTIIGKILPFKYDNLVIADKGYLIASKNGKIGIVKIQYWKHKEIVKCMYDSIGNINSFFLIKKDGKYGVLNSEFKVIIPIEYDKITSLAVGKINRGIFKCKKKNKYYIRNKYGELTPEGYSDVKTIPKLIDDKSFISYYTYFTVALDSSKIGILNSRGELVLSSFEFDIIGESQGIVIVKNNLGKFGLYDLDKKEIILAIEYNMILASTVSNYYTEKDNIFYHVRIQGEKVIINSIINK